MSIKLLSPENLPVINGEKVILRPITDADTADIVRWRNDSEVQQHFIFRETFTPEMHRNWLRTRVATGEVIQYMVIDKADGKSVGSVYFRDIDLKNESAEYGIFIGEASARGRGIGTEIASLFLQFGFNVLKLHRISIRVLSNNAASINSCRKAGFEPEGTFRHMLKLDGEFIDVIFMAKLKEEN